MQLFIQDLQTLLGDVIGRDIIYRDLQPLQPSLVQPLNALWHQQVAVGDHARDHVVVADTRDDGIQLGMQERLASADSDD